MSYAVTRKAQASQKTKHPNNINHKIVLTQYLIMSPFLFQGESRKISWRAFPNVTERFLGGLQFASRQAVDRGDSRLGFIPALV